MDTLITERHGRIFLTSGVRVVRDRSEISEDFAASTDDWELEKSNPFIKWLAGDFVEADHANSNTQFWTKDDLALNEYSIKYSPLNMLHKQTTPVGFFLASRMVNLGDAAADGGSAKIEALAGMWSHVFPWEAALVDQADELGQLYFSMECRGTHLHCAGPNGCDKEFAYSDTDNHCAHLRERSSVRHIVNPTFRGGALIIPPTRPGWNGATASVYEDAIKDEAGRYAEMTQDIYESANAGGADLSTTAWEYLMAEVLTLADH